jgi:hypothetical protein
MLNLLFMAYSLKDGDRSESLSGNDDEFIAMLVDLQISVELNPYLHL